MILRIYILLFLCAIISAQDFEVDGDLKVIGDLQASKIDSLESSIDSLRIQIQQLNSLLNNSYLKFIERVSVSLDQLNEEYEYFVEANTLNEFLIFEILFEVELDYQPGGWATIRLTIDGSGAGDHQLVDMSGSTDFGIYSIYRHYYELTEDNIANGFNVKIEIVNDSHDITINQLYFFGR